MLFNPQPETLNEASLLGTLLEGSSYSLDSKPITNVGTIGHASLPALNPIAEAVTTAMADGHFKLLEGLMEEDFALIARQLDEEFASMRTDMSVFNEGVAVFAKSKEFKDIEGRLDVFCKQTQGFMLDAVGLNKEFANISSELEKYFGFGNLVIACKGFDGLGTLVGLWQNSANRAKMLEKIEKDAEGFRNRGFDDAMIDREVEKAKREVEKATAPGRVLLGGASGLSIPNAFTSKKDFISQMKQQFSSLGEKVNGKDGRIRWNSDVAPYSYIEIQLGLMATRDMNGGNILSIILHEIGHNFYQGSILSRLISVIFSVLQTMLMMYKYVEYYASKAAISLIAKSKMLTNAYNLLYSAIFNVINVGMSVMMLNVSGKVAGLLGPAAGEVLDFVFTTGKAVINAMIAFSPAMIGGAIAALTNPMSLAQIISMDGLSEEVFCDNFAAAHGYGPELSDALAKMSNVHSWKQVTGRASNLDAIRSAIALVNSILTSFAHIADVHPTSESRALFMVDYYKAELAKTKDPKTRKYIEELITKTMKHSNIYRVSAAPIKADLLKQALNSKQETLFHSRTTSLFDILKNALSPETGSMNNLSKAVMK